MGGYVFGVTGEGCGCVSMNVSGDTTSVTCSGWTAAGQTCSFEVRTLSQDCGFTSDPVTESIALKCKLYIIRLHYIYKFSLQYHQLLKILLSCCPLLTTVFKLEWSS